MCQPDDDRPSGKVKPPITDPGWNLWGNPSARPGRNDGVTNRGNGNQGKNDENRPRRRF